MDVLKRRMFQEGGPVNVIESEPFYRGARVPTVAGTESLEEFDDGNFYFVRRDKRGNLIGKPKLVNLELSPTRDPKEALIRQQQNEGIAFGSGLLAAYTGAPILGPGAVSSAAAGLTALNIPKIASGISRSLLRRKDVDLPGDTVMKGAGKLELGPAGQFGVGSGIVYGAGETAEGLMTTEEDVLAEREALANFDDDLANLVAENAFDEEADQKRKEAENAVAAEQQREEEERKRKYDEFVSNIDKALALKDRKARIDRVMSAASNFYEPGMTRAEAMINFGKQLSAETDKEEAEVAAQIKKQTDEEEAKIATFNKNKYNYEQDLNNAIKELDTVDVGITVLKQALALVEQGGVTGFVPQFGELLIRAANYAGIDVPENNRMKAKLLLEYFAQGQVKNITGESGRTISNVDRQIAQKLVGNIKDIFATEGEVRGNLERTLDTFMASYDQANREYNRTKKPFEDVGVVAPYERNIVGRDIDSQREVVGADEAEEILASARGR